MALELDVMETNTVTYIQKLLDTSQKAYNISNTLLNLQHQ